ncbi:hypothetical protein DBV15_12411 [Temnothorax longispinosus]|uniref:Uncharacterized protein n=1 Tax=Temnothorax longispinosus TaxID=300112 RepID=A0A4S2KWU2_9HYME|nr:hypothetical protein DBV15_12411 [Temnothorax longispinosus]
MQPLDIALFHPFKDLWRKTIMKWKAENRILQLKKEHIPAVLEEALNSFDNEKQIIQNEFKATGLMLFNPDAIDDCQETESMKQHLLTFEKNLSDDVHQTFKKTEASGKWDHDIEKFALFEYWLDIKKAAGENLPETIQNVHEVISEGSNHCEKMVNEEVTTRPTGDMPKEPLQKNVECFPKMLSEGSDYCKKMVVEEVAIRSASSNSKESLQKDVECLSNILSEGSEHCEELVDEESPGLQVTGPKKPCKKMFNIILKS